jgi:phosphoribosylformimino-5-aminoimidazole carboxamide ribotide isomerase
MTKVVVGRLPRSGAGSNTEAAEVASAVRIIGVIDLLGGRAVHATGGCRHGYRPIVTAASTPIDGDAAALARLYTAQLGVGELYVADLDAIAGGVEQDAAVRDLTSPGAPVWLDAGVSTVAQAQRAIARGATRVVVGLETLTSFAALRDIATAVTPERVTFSLDLRDGRPITNDASIRALPLGSIAAQAVDAGARSVIVLDLARVGSGRGVDLGALDGIRPALRGVPLIAGGGVRGEEDLRSLASAGCDAVLVATALHGPGGADLVRYAASQVAVMRT